jgi:ribosome-associated protein
VFRASSPDLCRKEAAVLPINDQLSIPEGELSWSFVRSGGPGGQNVNKVASKAVLRWRLGENTTLPEEVKARLRGQQRRRITAEGELIVTAQAHRDQERNRQECVEKLQAMVRAALEAPKPRRPTRPTRGSKRRRLAEKRHRSAVKTARQAPAEE